MADQFDLEQGIMGCWQVTSDLDVLFEELVENDHFTKDQASNFALGLSTIYEAKFDKLFRTFEDFLKQYYRMRDELKNTQEELFDLREEMLEIEEANSIISLTEEDSVDLSSLFDEEEESLISLLEDNDNVPLDDSVLDDFGLR